MWFKYAHILTPLSILWSTKVKFKWTDVEQNALIEMNKILGQDVLLLLPNFSEESILHTNANKRKFGEIIRQNEKPIDFYSHKLTPAQINYTNI